MDTIVFTVCSRPSYLEEALSSWSAARGIQNWRVVFMIEPTPATKRQAEVIENFRHPNKQLVFNSERLGVLVNPWAGLDKCFSSGAEFTILAEEDVIVSSDVLEYFDFARGCSDDSTLAICANNRSSLDESKVSEVCRLEKFDPLIWGTWSDQWHSVLRDTWDKDYSTGEGGHYAGWDHNINRRLIPQHSKHVLFPHQSRSDHIGEIAGTHCVPEFFPETQAPCFVLDRAPLDYVLV